MVFYQCQAYTSYFVYEARSHNIDLDYTDSNGNFRVNWHSKDNCPMTFATGYLAIILCLSWIPLCIIYMKIFPSMKSKGFVSLHEKRFNQEKNKVGFFGLWTFQNRERLPKKED